jgi:hypothetical protein
MLINIILCNVNKQRVWKTIAKNREQKAKQTAWSSRMHGWWVKLNSL